MKFSIAYGLIGVLFAIATLSAKAASADISGKYLCQGHDPFQKANFKMPVTVTKTQDTYQFEALDELTNEKYMGTGVFMQNDPYTLAVSYQGPSGQPPYLTIGLYKVQKDGSLKTTWTLQGEHHVATETCKKI